MTLRQSLIKEAFRDWLGTPGWWTGGELNELQFLRAVQRVIQEAGAGITVREFETAMASAAVETEAPTQDKMKAIRKYAARAGALTDPRG